MKDKTNTIPFSTSQERIHAVTHLLGVIFVLPFGYFLYQTASHLQETVAIIIYLSTFFGVFVASAVYHAISEERWKVRLRKVDHLAIYFFIAGSNTPYLLTAWDDPWSPYLLALMWMMVLVGTLKKLLAWNMKPWISLAYYLVMGWLGIFTIYLIWPFTSTWTLRLVLLGGVLYTMGTYFYHHDHRKWYHTIWHLFVLMAACTHFAALYYHMNEI